MKCAIYLDKYEMELTIYKVFSDGSLKKVCKVYEKNNFLHLDVTADCWKYLIELNDVYHLLDSDMVGVSLNILYDDLINSGMIKM